MRLGVSFPMFDPDGRSLSGDGFIAGVRACESAGFDGVWAFDAVGRGFFLPDPLAACVTAAAVTERIEVGTCILQVAPRNPVDLAHRILTAHLLCRGRLTLGVGAGSTESDFAAMDASYPDRMRTFAASLDTIRRLLRGEAVDGTHLTPPAEALGGPPMLVGSWAGATWIRRAAHDLDGWIASGAKTSFRTLADGIVRFRQAGGGRAVVANVAVDLSATGDTLGDDEPFHLRCTPEAAARRLGRIAELGFDDVVLFVVNHSQHNLLQVAELRAACR